MARLKKAEIIKELTLMGVAYSGDMNYNDLYKLYKESKEKQETALNAVYTYKADEGEELLIDRPSEPVELIVEKTKVFIEPIRIKTDKVIYEQFISGDKDFDVYFGEEKVFSTKTTDIQNIKPLDEHFVVFGKNYTYQGARIKYC